jgi:hypothetical protein
LSFENIFPQVSILPLSSEVTMGSLSTLQADLEALTGKMTREDLRHVEANEARLIPGHYVRGDQRCIMALFTERHSWPIVSKESLAWFFTGLPLEQAVNHPDYQGPKWLVRWFDGDLVDRYGGVRMTWDERKALVLKCIRAEIARRNDLQATASDVLSAATDLPSAIAAALA